MPPPVASAPPVPSSTGVPARELPTLAPLTAARLNAASAGWVTGWAKGAYGFRDNERTGTVWLVAYGDRLDMLTVVSPRAPEDDALDRIAAALAADVQTLR